MSSAPDRTDAPFRRVAVVGLGVMGGSLARDLSTQEVEVTGWSPDPSERAQAREAGAVAAAPDDLDSAVGGAELVVLAVPLSAARELLPRVARTAPGALLTDVVSLKGPLARTARRAALGERWVGSHPMAGSEESGFQASRRGLYRGVPVWIVAEGASARARERVAELWRSVGGEPRSTSSEAHDRLMALVSHLPQLTANALASVLAEAGVAPGSLGPGGRDMTRLAGSSWSMWGDLLAEAPADLPRGLRALAQRIVATAEALEEGESTPLRELMESTRGWRGGEGTP